MDTVTTNTESMKKSDNKILTILGVIILVVICSATSFVGGRIISPPSSGGIFGTNLTSNNAVSEDADMNMFWSVWNSLKDGYVDSTKYNSTNMINGAIKGMVQSFDDPATIYFTAEETQKFNKENSGKYFEGIGAELGYRDGLVVVVAPIPGSPAEKAGVRAGDVILKVDDNDIKTTDTVFDVVDMIRGDAGTKVVIVFYRESESTNLTIEIIRGEITLPPISVKNPSDLDPSLSNYDGKVAILSLSRFTDSTLEIWKDDWDVVVNQLVQENYKAIVIDLRNNPGGFFDAAIYSASDFLNKGITVVKDQDRNGKVTEYKVEKAGKLLNIPIILLVNDGSASSSEIFSGALQQADRAKVVGVSTYGKGTAQNIYDLEDGSSLHLTIMKWLLPDGTWINKDNPIKPDLEIKKTDEDFKLGLDPQLKAALEEITK